MKKGIISNLIKILISTLGLEQAPSRARRSVVLNNMISLSLVVFVFFSLSLSSLATGERSDDINFIALGADIMGRGDWYAAKSTGAGAPLLNPAGLGLINNLQITSMYASLMSSYDYLMLASTIPLSNGTSLGLGVVYAGIDAGCTYDSSNNPGDQMKYTDTLFLLSLGSKISGLFSDVRVDDPALSLGGKLKIYQKGWSGANDLQGRGVGLDLGADYQLNKDINLGLMLINPFMSKITWDDGREEKLNSVIKLGFAMNIYLSSDQKNNLISLGSDLDIYDIKSNNILNHIGIEYLPIKYLSLRMGVDQMFMEDEVYNNLDFGVGINYANFKFDYAYHPYGEFTENNTHYFSFSYVGEPNAKVIPLASYEPKTEKKAPVIQESVVAQTPPKAPIIQESVVAQTPTIVPKLPSHSDVPQNNLLTDQINILNNLDLIRGYPDGTFKLDREITRAEMATMLVRVTGKEDLQKFNQANSSEKTRFTDIDHHWAKQYIITAQKAGYIEGDQDNKFRPDSPITRAEAIILLVKFDGIKYSKDSVKNVYQDIEVKHWASAEIYAAKQAGLLNYIDGNLLLPENKVNRKEMVKLLFNTSYVRNKIQELYNWDLNKIFDKELSVTENIFSLSQDEKRLQVPINVYLGSDNISNTIYIKIIMPRVDELDMISVLIESTGERFNLFKGKRSIINGVECDEWINAYKIKDKTNSSLENINFGFLRQGDNLFSDLRIAY